MRAGVVARKFGVALRAVFARALGVEREVYLVVPPEFGAREAHGVVAVLGGGVPLGEVGRVRGELEDDHALADIVALGEAEVLFGGHIAEHGGSARAYLKRAQRRRHVVVARAYVGDERPERVERRLGAPVELAAHITCTSCSHAIFASSP